MQCSMARSLEVIGDWWTPLILRDLYLGLHRFDELATDLEISRNLLSTRLTALVDDGIVERRRYHEHPPRDEYALTEAGRDLVPLLMALTAWGDRWVAPAAGPPVRFRHHDCGAEFVPEVHCSECHEPIHHETRRRPPRPGRRAGPGTRSSRSSSATAASSWQDGGPRIGDHRMDTDRARDYDDLSDLIAETDDIPRTDLDEDEQDAEDVLEVDPEELEELGLTLDDPHQPQDE